MKVFNKRVLNVAVALLLFVFAVVATEKGQSAGNAIVKANAYAVNFSGAYENTASIDPAGVYSVWP